MLPIHSDKDALWLPWRPNGERRVFGGILRVGTDPWSVTIRVRASDSQFLNQRCVGRRKLGVSSFVVIRRGEELRIRIWSVFPGAVLDPAVQEILELFLQLRRSGAQRVLFLLRVLAGGDIQLHLLYDISAGDSQLEVLAGVLVTAQYTRGDGEQEDASDMGTTVTARGHF